MSDEKKNGARLRDSDADAASEAGRMLGSIKTPRKAETARENILKAKERGIVGGRPQKAILDSPCTCGAGDTLEGHPTTCPRGLAIWRRRRAGKPVEL